MSLRQVWTAVKVVTPQGQPQHAREGQAGVVHAVDPAELETVAIRFDSDNTVEIVRMDHLQVLG